MGQEVELSALDLRYESYRMKNPALEGRMLASIAQRGVEEPLEGVESTNHPILLNGFKRCRCAWAKRKSGPSSTCCASPTTKLSASSNKPASSRNSKPYAA